MARKRDTSPEALLQRLITALEQDSPQAFTSAMESLLHGPFRCEPAVATEAWELRAELLAFLRSAVDAAVRETISYGGIGTYGFFTFRAEGMDGGRVRIVAGGRDARDLVVLQLMVLLHLVGLHNVRRCELRECGRMFVKRYRREYCSSAHQGLANKRRQRLNNQMKRERAAARRRARTGV